MKHFCRVLATVAVALLLTVSPLVTPSAHAIQDPLPPRKPDRSVTGRVKTPRQPAAVQSPAEDMSALAAINILGDPGFETYALNDFWVDSYTWGSPLCTPDDCWGINDARTGSAWAWFGGWEDGLDESSLSQTVTIPSGTATLEFYLAVYDDPWIPGDANDRFTVMMDGDIIFTANATQEAQYWGYTLVPVDVSAYANGAVHTLVFSSTITTIPDQYISFYLDDVALLSETAGPEYAISGNAAVAGTVLTYTGGSTTAGPGGAYSFTVPEGWTGTVTPSKAGYVFTPPSRTYPTGVTADQTAQDYTAVASGNLVEDPSFELDTPNPFWSETYNNYSPFCTEACGGFNGARTGLVWLWFGGYGPGLDESSLSQPITIPDGTATLEFYFLIGDETGSDANDRFTATMDGATVFSANATQEDQYLDYTLISVDVSAWADDAEHTLEFSSTITDQYVAFFVDDVSLVAVSGPQYTISGNAAVAGTILSYTGGSTTAGPGGDYSFTVPEGWTGTVTPARAGYTFTPPSNTYTNVTADQTGDDYTVTAPFGNLIEDPSFEAYVPNPYWTEIYSNAPILCTAADCGGPGARTGLAWVWFGGLEVPSDTSSVSQAVTIPNGVTTLEFYLLLYTDPGSDANDEFIVKIDDTTVFSANATQEAQYLDYTLVPVDVSAHADGAVHTLEFSSITTDQAVSFWLDDVSLEAPLTISGNAGVGGVTLTYTGGEPVTAGPSGAYSLPVPDGWTGTVTPSKTGYTFEPSDRTYSTPVTGHLTEQDYTATALLGSIVRVKTVGAASAGCGTTWADPCELQYALANTASGSEIWVAAGTYTPDSGDRTTTFQLRSGVAIYGGFAGTESARGERNHVANVTTLSGDLLGNDNDYFDYVSDNSYHVVTSSGADNTAVLDGFTIKGGNASAMGADSKGGGMHNDGGSPALTNIVFSRNLALTMGGGIHNTGHPTLTNVAFDGNTTWGGQGGGIYNTGNPILTGVTFNNSNANNGGGLHNYGGSPVLTNVVFNNNHAGTSGSGGGMYTDGGSPVLSDVTFSGNSASSGGGLFVQGGSPTLTDIDFFDNDALDGAGMHNSGLSTISSVTFRSNTATRNGGGLFNNTYSTFTNVTFFDNEATQYAGGGMSSYGSPVLTNVTFSGNHANYGGALLNSDNTVLRNVIVWGNTATTAGPQMYNDPGVAPDISNSVVQDGCPEGGVCTNIITADPLLGPLGSYGGDTQTIPLLPGSSAINAAGSNCPTADQRSAARGTLCDAGAFESQGFSLTLTGGDNQSMPTGAASPQPLALSVVPNVAGEPVDGGRVTFSGPASGASTSPVTSAVTISGSAASQTVTANSIPGLYIVNASAAGAPASLAFHLTNIGTDTTAPVVTIESLSPDPTNASATISWHANENGPYSVRVSGTDCATGSVVDSGTYYTAPATVDFILTAGSLTEGPNTIRVCVTDSASNTGSAADSVTRDVTAPQTSLDSHPANPSSSSSASFTFSGTDNLTPSLSLAFECRLDGGSFSACTNPREYTGLADGSHTFEVIASDLAGNDDLSPASYTWTIDAVPVVLSITRDSANPTAAGSVDFLVTFSETVTGVNIPDFTLTTAGVTGAQVTGLTGSGAIYTVTVNTGTVGSVNGSVRLNLYDNDSIRDATSHRLGGTGTGNGSFNMGQSYIVAGHMSAPRLVSLSKNQITNDSTPAFTWSAVTDAEYYEIVFATNSAFTQNVQRYYPDVESFTSSVLPDGKYYWRVRAYNAVGEPGTWSASRYFTVDTTLPTVPSSTAPANGTSLKGVPIFRWQAVSGAVRYQFQIDDDPNFLSPLYTIDQRLTSRRLPGGIRGTYYWKVRARDAAGNWSSWSPASSITILPPR